MAVSKRLRFEVFRRDNYTCRYCGAKAPDAELQPDHVLPTALGGTDDPENLVTACADCNSGKASVAPDSPTVADVTEDAIRWARAAKAAAAEALNDFNESQKYIEAAVDAWTDFDKELRYMPSDADSTIARWRSSGLPLPMLTDAIWIAWSNTRVSPYATWRYTCGIVKNRIADIDQRTQTLVRLESEGGDPEP